MRSEDVGVSQGYPLHCAEQTLPNSQTVFQEELAIRY
jgi:hypothetical protein